jgi:hypothetical protein
MAVHVAEAADVHQDVKPKSRSGVEGAKSLIVGVAVAQAQLDNFGDASLWQPCNQVAN